MDLLLTLVDFKMTTACWQQSITSFVSFQGCVSENSEFLINMGLRETVNRDGEVKTFEKRDNGSEISYLSSCRPQLHLTMCALVS